MDEQQNENVTDAGAWYPEGAKQEGSPRRQEATAEEGGGGALRLPGSVNVGSAAIDSLHSLLVSNRPALSWPWPYPRLTVGLVRRVPWVGLHACVLLPCGS